MKNGSLSQRLLNLYYKMKKKFSTQWIGSSQPRKQRKYLANAPLSIKRKMISSNLNKELRKKHGRRSFVLRKGDEVRVMIGQFKGKTGKVSIVDTKKLRVNIDGIQRTKKDGTKINVNFNASNLQIQTLNLDDKKRLKSIGKETENKEDKKEANTQ